MKNLNELNILYLLENPISNWVMDEIIEIKKYIKQFNYVSIGGYTDKYKEKIYHKIYWKNIFFSFIYILFHPIKSYNIIKQYKKEIGITLIIETFGIIHIIKQNKINHIHCHFASASTTSALILNKLLKVNFSFTAHAYDIFKNTINKNLLVEKLKKASFIRTISNYNKNYLISLLPQIKDKIYVIHCGINLKNFPFNNENQLIKRKIISASNFVPKKGYVEVLKTINEISDNLNFYWKISGKGPEKTKIQSFVDDLKNIKIAPFIPHKDLSIFFKDNDIFFLPCIISNSGDRDGIPVILMEAMASGIIVISTDISGIPELIKNDINGFIINKPSIKKLTEKINYINVQSSEKISNIKLAARDTIEKNFNIEHTTNKIIALFTKYE